MFALDMHDEERQIMARLAEHWRLAAFFVTAALSRRGRGHLLWPSPWSWSPKRYQLGESRPRCAGYLSRGILRG
jgi:hypothetical protein